MLNDTALGLWFQRLGLSEHAQAVIRHVRSSDPARRVGSRRHNVAGRYPSKKMGAVIQFESHRVELAQIYSMEHDPAVLEYYDQPPPIKLEYDSGSGRKLGVLHTADYFVLRNESAGWVECKTEEDLTRLAEKSPNRYALNDGQWRCKPGEAYAERLGLNYMVRSSREINWIFQANLQFLEDYFGELASLRPGTAEKVYAHVAASPGITLETLFAESDSFCSRDDIYFMIARDRLFVDLRVARLSDAAQVRVFANASAAAASSSNLPKHSPPDARLAIDIGGSIIWDAKPWKVVNIGEGIVSLLGESQVFSELRRAVFEQLIQDQRIVNAAKKLDIGRRGEALTRISTANEAELRRANYRYGCVYEFMQGKRTDSGVPARTLRRWVSKYRQAERTFGNGFVGLLSDNAQKGNATPKMPEATRLLIDELIAQDYETLKQKNKRASWLKLRLECERRSLLAPSYRTFSLAIKKRSGFNQTLKRKGYRAACQKEPFYFELDLKTPRHGARPFEIGHIDHTQLDLELVCSLTGRPLGRPWLSILTDAFSRR